MATAPSLALTQPCPRFDPSLTPARTLCHNNGFKDIQMIEATVSVSEAEVEFFHREGFLAVARPLSTPDELAEVVAIYDRLFAERAGWERGDSFDLAGTDDESDAALPQLLGPSKYAPELKETLYYANAMAIAAQLLPGGKPGGDHAILKPAHHGAPAPWHQDQAYWNPALDYTSLSVWVPLQGVDETNGCMQFVPGTHTLDVLPHHTINEDPRIHALELDDLDQMSDLLAQAVTCPLPAGGATFHLSRTFHYTGPNRSDRPRRAHILGFGLPPVPATEPRSFPWNERKTTAREARRQQWETTHQK